MQPWLVLGVDVLSIETDGQGWCLGCRLDVAQLIAIVRRVALPLPQCAVGEDHGGGVAELARLDSGDELAFSQVAIFGEQRVAPLHGTPFAVRRHHPQVGGEGGGAVACLLIVVVSLLVLPRLPCDGTEHVTTEHLGTGDKHGREAGVPGAGQQGGVGHCFPFLSQGTGVDSSQGGVRCLDLTLPLLQLLADGDYGVVAIGLPHQ